MTSYSQRTPKILNSISSELRNQNAPGQRKKFSKFFSNDLFHKINNDPDFIAPLRSRLVIMLAPIRSCSSVVHLQNSRTSLHFYE